MGRLAIPLKRADLYTALNEQAAARGICTEHGKRLVSAERDGNGVRVQFADGTAATGDILIGCDGIRSMVRQIIDPKAPAPKYAGLINLGGYVRGVRVDANPGTYHLIFGKRAFFGYAVAPDGEVWWFANVPQPQEPARSALAAINTEGWRRRRFDLSPMTQAQRPTSSRRHLTASLPARSTPCPTCRSGTPIGWLSSAMPRTRLRQALVKGPRFPLRTPCSWRNVCATAVMQTRHSRPLSKRGVAVWSASSKRAARINNDKATSGIGAVFRDLMMPLFLKLMTNERQQQELYGYRVEWGSPVSASRSSPFV